METDVAMRLARVREAMGRSGLDGLIVCDASDRRYLTGYNSVYRRGVAVLSPDDIAIVTYPTEARQAKLESGMTVMEYQGYDPGITLAKAVFKVTAGLVTSPRVGFGGDLGADLYLSLMRAGVTLVPAYGLMPGVRAIKTPSEIEGFRRSAREHDRAIEFAEGVIREGVTEVQVRAEIDSFFLRSGAEGFTFETVVLSGERSACAHCRPKDRVMVRGDLVTVDFGAIFDGCDSDICRTYSIGPGSPELVKKYEVLKEAQAAAMAKCVPGSTGHDVDKAARDVIARAGWGDLFVHGVGHGLCGGPNLSPGSEDVLQPGMIVAIEPAIYMPGMGGMRYENDFLVTETKPEQLTGFGGRALKAF